MRRGLATVFLAAGLLAGSTATAGPIGTISVGDTVRIADGPGTTGGGEFVMTVNGSSFTTFCLQRTEYINFTSPFTVGGINTYTLTDPVANGGDSQGRDFISQQTAYLYTQFRAGTLAGYDYTGAGRTNSANLLQNAFWMLEQELTMNSSNRFVMLANQAIASGKWSGIGNVRVLNLIGPGGGEAQDQLALVPEPETVMLMLLGVAIAMLPARRNRRRSVV